MTEEVPEYRVRPRMATSDFNPPFHDCVVDAVFLMQLMNRALIHSTTTDQERACLNRLLLQMKQIHDGLATLDHSRGSAPL